MLQVLPLSKDQQIEAMLSGTIVSIVAKHNQSDGWNIRPYVRVSRDDIRSYLRAHGAAAREFYSSLSTQQGTHDVPRVDEVGEKYRVAWMDHGKAVDASWYDTLEDALAEWIVNRYGLWR